MDGKAKCEEKESLKKKKSENKSATEGKKNWRDKYEIRNRGDTDDWLCANFTSFVMVTWKINWLSSLYAEINEKSA